MKILRNAAALCCFASAAAAQSYECEVKGGDSFIPPAIRINLDGPNGRAIVYDGLIHSVIGEPITAKKKQQKNGTWRLQWVVLNVPASPRDADVRFRAVLDTEKQSINLRGTIPGALNSVVGNGPCKPIEF